uniref:Uncharacterized protein n=1 Tax=Arundo donax TaxID=35708 RepID=A0A0A9H8X4_ARUDO
MGQSAGWKKRILSSSWPSCCPRLRSNTQSCAPSPAAADESPIRPEPPKNHPRYRGPRGRRRGAHATPADPVRRSSPGRDPGS